MQSIISGSVMCKGKYNNYLVGGNICNAFAIGELGSDTDFFLVGVEPPDESNYPLLTGNILDSEGNVLFRLVRNILVINPGHCSKITSDRVGYEIHDGNDKLILKVSTAFERLPGDTEPSFVTKMSANFYNKDGNLVFVATEGAYGERIESSVKSAYGFAHDIGMAMNFNDNELELARVMFRSQGKINRLITGDYSEPELALDGVALINANVSKSMILISTGDFIIDDAQFKDVTFRFSGAAANIRSVVQKLDTRASQG
jgi:hypothetical protein